MQTVAARQVSLAIRKHERSLELPFQELDPKITDADLGKVIVIKRGSNQLLYYNGDKLKRTFRVATGQSSYPTPLGNYEIVTMQRNPWWYPPQGSAWAEGATAIPPGPGEPARNAVDGHLVAVRRNPRDAGRRVDRLLRLARVHPDADPAGRVALPAGRRRDARVHRPGVSSDTRPGRVQRIAQLAALIGVAALLALLIWKVAFGRTTGAADELAEGKLVHAPAFTLDRLDRDGQLAVADLKGKGGRRQLLGVVVHPVPRRGAGPPEDVRALP